MVKQVALVALLVGSCLMAVAAEVNSDEEAPFAAVFAERGSGKKATVGETRDAINRLWAEIERAEIADDMEDHDEMVATQKRFGELVKICELSRDNCPTVFNLIESVRGEMNEELLNLGAYVEDCLEQQRMYCGQK